MAIYSSFWIRLYFTFRFFCYFLTSVVASDVSFLGDFSGFNVLSNSSANTDLSSQFFEQTNNGSLSSLIDTSYSNSQICYSSWQGDLYVIVLDSEQQTVLLQSNFTSNPTSLEIFSSQNTSFFGNISAIFCDDKFPYAYATFTFSDKPSFTSIYRWNVTNSNVTIEHFYNVKGNVDSLFFLNNDSVAISGNFTEISPFSSSNGPQIAKLAFRSNNSFSQNSLNRNLSSVSCDLTDSYSLWDPSSSGLVSIYAWAPYLIDFNRIRFYNYESSENSVAFFSAINPADGTVLPLTHYDLETGLSSTCDVNCSLQNFANYQDFYFSKGYNSYQIEIQMFGNGEATENSAFGLSSLQFFETNQNSYFDDSYNQESCGFPGLNSLSSYEGNFEASFSNASMPYWIQTIAGEQASVSFFPNITVPTNGTVQLLIPGCTYDNTCSQRGSVIANVYFAKNKQPATKLVQQASDFDQYVSLYSGYLQGFSDNFRPYVELLPYKNSRMVTHSIRFLEQSYTNVSNGLVFVNTTTDVNKLPSIIEFPAASKLRGTAISQIKSLSNGNFSLYMTGNFSDNYGNNVVYMDSLNHLHSFPNNGLNGWVSYIYVSGDSSYFGGNFTHTGDGSIKLNYIAMYSETSRNWSSLGLGTNGPVTHIGSTSLFIDGKIESFISFQGDFNEVYTSEGYAISTSGFSLWNPSSKSWVSMEKLGFYMSGYLFDIPGFNSTQRIYSGNLSAIASYSTRNIAHFSSDSLNDTFIPCYVNAFPSYIRLEDIAYPFANNSMIAILGSEEMEDKCTAAVYFANSTEPIYPKRILSANCSSKFIVLEDCLIIYSNDTDESDIVKNTFVSFNTTSNSLGNTTALSQLKGHINSVIVDDSYNNIFFGGNLSEQSSGCVGFCIFEYNSSSWRNISHNLISAEVQSILWVNETYSSMYLAGKFVWDTSDVDYLLMYNFDNNTIMSCKGSSSIPGPVLLASLKSQSKDEYSVLLYGTEVSSSDTYLNVLNSEGAINSYSLDIHLNQSTINSIDFFESNQISQIPINDSIIVLSGLIVLDDSSKASAVYCVNKSCLPLLTAFKDNGEAGIVRKVVQQKSFSSSASKMIPVTTKYDHIGQPRYVVIISLGISIGVMFLIMSGSIVVEIIHWFFSEHVETLHDYSNFLKELKTQ
ncbi:Polarized growth protein rax2 [Schizosaccharomyces pombe]|uniref:Polarized growth protein rax2 n=1 Tax=Schizosaccharomyces pombe (strain 972 / ATCC 24843) TaxID=284812 RepID=RAX2_SCHPO|nr:cell polarity factor Rax2 [Schizosaccharomyces pombe]O14239.1 RecName: Full=Polarized growth protein rax2; AltName: Full=Revert to axial protein 2; Flags: Precursor [Schizosaccharomyces pombe 972h-]CAB11730.1 cell polarity factor Rax2 [Schizosaccharomyces pombe]|eukprot:NP_593899.1 cell polarity factor Rax2 [Schizosaccharomyces pombe]